MGMASPSRNPIEGVGTDAGVLIPVAEKLVSTRPTRQASISNLDQSPFF